MDAAGGGRLGQDLDEGELEKIRQRVLREAEENFKLEIRKLRGETGTDTIGVIIRPLLAVIVELLKLLKVTEQFKV